MTRDEFLELSDERDQWTRRLLDGERAAFLAGAAAGYRAGYERGARVLEAQWPQIVKPLQGPTVAELERLRWGPGGREHFADPRPGDRYPLKRERAA